MSVYLFHPDTVIAVVKDGRGASDASSVSAIYCGVLFSGMSAQLTVGAKVRMLEGPAKRLGWLTLSSVTGDKAMLAAPMSVSNLAGDKFEISFNYDAASRRNFLLAGSATPRPNPNMIPRDIYMAGKDPKAQVNARTLAEFGFVTEVKGSGTKNVASDIGSLLEACDFTATPGTDDVTYTPHSTDDGVSVTIYMWKADQMFVSRCSKATGRITTAAGGYGTIAWTTMGFWDAPSAVSAPAAVHTGDTQPIQIAQASISIAGYYPALDSLEVDIGNNLQFVPDAAGIQGVGAIRVSDHEQASGRMTISFPTLTAYNAFAKLTGNTREAFTVVLGDTDGNKLSLAMPKIQIDGLDLGNDANRITQDLNFRPTADSGDDYLVIQTL